MGRPVNAVVLLATRLFLKGFFRAADETNRMQKRILIVVENAALAAELDLLVGSIDGEPVVAQGAAEAIARLGQSGPHNGLDLCLVDLDLPAAEGTAVVLKARACRPPVPAVALTARGAGAVEALCAGAAEIVAKPFSASRLGPLLRRLADTGSARRPAASAALLGDHPLIREALARAEQIAATDVPVLLCGETGTGKETLARLVHGASGRRDRPFVAVNLAAIPEPFVETELFGQASLGGDVDRRRAGWLTAAHGGTLFVEEIDQLPPSVQRKLGRVLRERTVTSVGGAPVPLDVRLVAATRNDLRDLVNADRFDEELYDLLTAAPIELPPLRERRQDIPVLAEHFRQLVNAREGRHVPGFALDVMHRLSQHDWPGNVRELEHLCERLVVTVGTRMVVMKDLPAHLRIHVIDFERATRRLPQSGVDLRVLLTELEEHFIAEALARTGGNRNRAAELLGLNRTTLVEKLRRRVVA
jgi:two-component system, NtrC family, response regulator AtoC